MKSKALSFAGTILLVFFCTNTYAQSFGINASAVWVDDCNQSNFYNTSGSGGYLIGPAGNTFTNNDFGVHTQNSGTLVLRGAQAKTFKNPASSNVCNVKMYYRVYLQSGTPGAFTPVDLPFLEDCSGGTFPSGGTCIAGDQKWQMINPSVLNLTSFASGKYVLEIYYEAAGSQTSTSGCSDIVTENNSGNNFKAFFSIQSPTVSSTNPSSCFGNQGSITIGGLVAGASYQLSYSDDGTNVGPNTYVANGSGQIVILNLNKGFYSNFTLTINGCTTNLFTGIILSDPIYVPTFTSIPPFCAGTTAPTLPTTSNNGITGTWNPAVVDNQNSGTYTFTPDANQCGIAITVNITVIPRTTPTFTFGTSSTICAGGSVPPLPTTSSNGITGTWSPATVDNNNSGTYTFTPSAGQCANPATFSVTVNPNITPTFDFGSSTTICAGSSVPSLPTTSTNGITGTWSPATVDNNNSGTYTFTPTAGQCATTTNFSVTVNPNITPTFSFGTSLSICAGGSAPTLPTTSDNSITGTWSPATVDNNNSGTYTFTPTAGQCATTTNFSVTVNPNITPTFSFGTSLSICAGGSVPTLPSTSDNSITGTWSPATVDNNNSGTYTFTPDAGQCATTTTFTVTVNPNITPAFSFGTSLTICAGGSVPSLPTNSTNGITGTWSPATVDNNNSGTYTFTPDAGQCATTTTFTVTVNPNITPAFSFGTSSTICAGSSVPSLPTTSTNGITGTWSPATVDNNNSGTYTFTPDAGQCVTGPVTFSVSVTPNTIPTFSFGSSLTICAGGTVPTLYTTSDNGVTGTWSPATIDNNSSGTYTFTPTAGQCATTFEYTVTVNPIITPTFSFGTSQSVCIGSVAPVLPTTSTNGITGTWSPATVDNNNSGTYTFTPDAGQCATGTTFSYQVNPVPSVTVRTDTTVYDGDVLPAFNFIYTPGSSLNWTSNNTSIGVAASGTITVPSFTAINMTNAPVTATITATPNINGCTGVSQSYKITVLPKDKDVFVPNVFSPNGDGKNDFLFVYGNYIDKLDMRIFNQWGQQIAVISNKAQSWDGRHKGNPQPVGVYMYVCKAVLTDGRTINLKGSITLIR